MTTLCVLCRLQPRMVHRSMVTDVVENITLMHCPPERTVKVPVPVQVTCALHWSAPPHFHSALGEKAHAEHVRAHAQLMGEDMAPGIKKGGYLNLLRRRLNCVGPARLIPRAIEVDVSALDFGQRIYVSSLQLPSGVSIVDKVGEAPASLVHHCFSKPMHPGLHVVSGLWPECR